jgi:hypothetical protein
LPKHQDTCTWEGECLQSNRSRLVIHADEWKIVLPAPLSKILGGFVVMDVLIAVSDHGATPIPALATDDVHLLSKERIRCSDYGADIEVVLEILNRNMEGMPTFIKIGDDRLD